MLRSASHPAGNWGILQLFFSTSWASQNTTVWIINVQTLVDTIQGAFGTPFPPKNLTLTCSKWWKMGFFGTAHFWTVWYWVNSFVQTLVFILPKNASPPKKMGKYIYVEKYPAEIFHLVIFIIVLLCSFRVIHSWNKFPLLVRICVSILSLPTDRYQSKDISIMTKIIKKSTSSHESSLRAHFHHINIFFLEFVLASKNPKASWMVSTTLK